MILSSMYLKPRLHRRLKRSGRTGRSRPRVSFGASDHKSPLTGSISGCGRVILRLPGAERGWQVDGRAHAVHALAPEQRKSMGRRPRRRLRAPGRPGPNRRCPPGGGTRRPPDRARAAVAPREAVRVHLGSIQWRIAGVLSMVDIGDAIDRRVGGYSGGMKRREDFDSGHGPHPQPRGVVPRRTNNRA